MQSNITKHLHFLPLSLSLAKIWLCEAGTGTHSSTIWGSAGLGSVYVNEIVNRCARHSLLFLLTKLTPHFQNLLTNRLTSTSTEKTYVEFGHDTSIAVALTGLGLFKYKRGTQPLPPPRASCTRPDHERTSREHNKTYIDYTAHLHYGMMRTPPLDPRTRRANGAPPHRNTSLRTLSPRTY